MKNFFGRNNSKEKYTDKAVESTKKIRHGTGNDYIAFCKKYCIENCAEQVINSHDFFAKCFFFENSGCKHDEHPENYSFKKSDNFFAADQDARKAAGLEGKGGSYDFICPNCGTKCRGSWLENGHGGTGCITCNIALVV